jgi:NitT/TauT family transport system ATP-binding protein
MNNSIHHNLIADKVSFRYKDSDKKEHKWEGLNFQVENGSVTSILGESGVGKTTLLKILSGIHAPEKGSVYINSPANVIQQPQSPIFVVFQDYNLTLLPWLTVRQNILLGQYKTGNKITNESVLKIVKELFKEFHSDHEAFLNKYPNNLSGGQRQRLQIARALVSDAQFIMFDEPDSAVDFRTKSSIRELIKYLSKEKKIGVIVITHDIENAIAFSNKIYVLARQDKEAVLKEFLVPDVLQKKGSFSEVVEADEFQIFKKQIIDQFYKLENAPA